MNPSYNNNPPYNYQQHTPGPPQPQWQAPPRRGWADPRLQQQQQSVPPPPTTQQQHPLSPTSPHHSFGSSNFGPPLPPPPSSSGHYDTSAWGVRYNQGLGGQQLEPKPPLPPRPDSASGRVSPQPDPALNYSKYQPSSSLHQPPSHQYNTSWSDPYNQNPPTQQSSIDPPPPPPPPRPIEYQTQAQAQSQPSYNRINTPHQEYSHHAPTHQYDPQVPSQWGSQNPTASAPAYPSTTQPQMGATLDAPLVSPIEASSSYWAHQTQGNTVPNSVAQQSSALALGYGGPSDWEHYASSPPTDTPTTPSVQPFGNSHMISNAPPQLQAPVSPPLPPPPTVSAPTKAPQIDIVHPAGPVEIGAASPLTAHQPQEPPPAPKPDFRQHAEERPSGTLAQQQSNSMVATDESTTIDSVVQAWTAPLHPRHQYQNAARPGSRDSARDVSLENTPTVRVVDEYGDLEPEFKASLKRYAAMLAKESAASTDEDKFNIFQSFVNKELRLRSLLYGVELPNVVKEVKKAASLADIQAALPANVKPADVSKAIDTLKRDGPASAHSVGQEQKSQREAVPIATGTAEEATAATAPNGHAVNEGVAPQVTMPTTQRAPSPARPPPLTQLQTKSTVEERPGSKDGSFVMVGSNGIEEGEYSPGGRPRVPQRAVHAQGDANVHEPHQVSQLTNQTTLPHTGHTGPLGTQVFLPGRADGSLSPSINAPMVIEDYRMPGPPSPGVNAPILVLPEMAPPSSAPSSSATNKPSKPIKFEPPRPAYTPFRYNSAVQDEKPKTLQPADKAYSSLRNSVVDSGRLMAIDTLAAPSRPKSAGGRREHEEAFIGLIRQQSMAVRKQTPASSRLVPDIIRPGTAAPDLRGPPPMSVRIGTPVNAPIPEDPMRKAVGNLRSVLPPEAIPATPIDGPNHPQLKMIRAKIDGIHDDFGFIHAAVVEWDRTNREVRKQQDAERQARQQESEAHIDALFNDNEIGYADIGELEADFKLGEAERRYRENQEELESFTTQVFNKVTDTLQREIAELTTAHTLAIDLLDMSSEAVSHWFAANPRLANERAKMSDVMSCVLVLFNKLEVRHQKLAEAHVERERRRKHLELTVLYTNGDTAGVKKLDSEFATAEKMQVLHEARARDSRANKLMDSFDRATVRGLGDNQTFVDDLLVKVQDIKRAIGKSDKAATEKMLEKDGVKDLLDLAQETVNLVITDSRRLLALSNEADVLLNESDYGVSVAEARVANADKATYSKLESEKKKEDTKLVEEMNARVSSVVKGPTEVLTLIKEILTEEGEDSEHKERMRKALEAAKQRNASVDPGNAA
ncbi:hypothetical protein PV10_02246 [Exophiala mesophila]|uniref:Uncharacterized protein n=1 Tax=Exophiala mesophila TaxID=212818 RepID=A0A0D1Y1T6_EXOME|nr:uncharacterized protein PV10_02246 [Exophiala mesophila]KIV94481.1 hypothetical protein PV10_02246 [Exophiala mesophila]